MSLSENVSPSFDRVGTVNLSVWNPEFTVRSQTYSFIDKFFSSKSFSKVLDYGAGESPYKNLFRTQEYCTLDIEQNKLKSIQLFLNPKTLEIPCKSESFDLVIALDVLEHVIDINVAILEIRRVLKDDALVLIKIPFIYREHELPYDHRRLTLIGLQQILKSYGFEVVDSKKLGNAWCAAYTLINELHEDKGEKTPLGYKIIRKLATIIILPILNLTLFKIPPINAYNSIIVVAKKKNVSSH